MAVSVKLGGGEYLWGLGQFRDQGIGFRVREA